MNNDCFKVRVWNVSGGYYLPDFYLTPAGEVCEFGVFIGTLMVRKFDNQENYRKERCTGLKDKNGRLIYEGDVLGFYINKRPVYVHWDSDKCRFVLRRFDLKAWELSITQDTASRYTIIGNIHEIDADLTAICEEGEAE